MAFFSLTGELKATCKYLFVGEAEYLAKDGKLISVTGGVEQCTYFYQKENLPPWVKRGADSYPIQYPSDCQNCPVYCADPIQQRILEEKKKRVHSPMV